jgi:hypothetical protein
MRWQIWQWKDNEIESTIHAIKLRRGQEDVGCIANCSSSWFLVSDHRSMLEWSMSVSLAQQVDQGFWFPDTDDKNNMDDLATWNSVSKTFFSINTFVQVSATKILRNKLEVPWQQRTTLQQWEGAKWTVNVYVSKITCGIFSTKLDLSQSPRGDGRSGVLFWDLA